MCQNTARKGHYDNKQMKKSGSFFFFFFLIFLVLGLNFAMITTAVYMSLCFVLSFVLFDSNENVHVNHLTGFALQFDLLCLIYGFTDLDYRHRQAPC